MYVAERWNSPCVAPEVPPRVAVFDKASLTRQFNIGEGTLAKRMTICYGPRCGQAGVQSLAILDERLFVADGEAIHCFDATTGIALGRIFQPAVLFAPRAITAAHGHLFVVDERRLHVLTEQGRPVESIRLGPRQSRWEPRPPQPPASPPQFWPPVPPPAPAQAQPPPAMPPPFPPPPGWPLPPFWPPPLSAAALPPPPPGPPPPATVAATAARNARYLALLGRSQQSTLTWRRGESDPLGGRVELCVSGDRLYVALERKGEVRVLSVNAAALRE